MKRAIALGLVLLMVLIMAACGGQGTVTEPEQGETAEEEASAEEEAPEAEEAEEEPQGEESAAAGEVTIDVTMPEGWVPIDSAGMIHAYQKSTASFMMKTEPFTVDQLDLVVQQAQEIFSGLFDNVEYEGDTESIKVGGVDASKMIFTCDFAGMTTKFEYIYLIIGGEVYAITFGDLEAGFDSNAADFQAILDSIVIS